MSAVLEVDQASGRLTYSVNHGSTTVIEPSSLGLILGDRNFSENTRIVEQHTYELNDTSRANGLLLSLESGAESITWQLEARAYNSGFAYRYIVPGAGTRRVRGEATSFVIPADTQVWFNERDSDWKLKTAAGWWTHAGIDAMPEVSQQGPVQGLPLLLELPSGGYAVITEANLFDYSGMRLRAEGNRTFRADFTEAEGFDLDGPITTPWRVVICANDLNALVNQHLVYDLADDPDPNLFPETGYIQPGRSVWRWWSSETGNPQQEMRFVDYARDLGFEYTTIDAGWKEWKQPWASLAKIGSYARSQGVGVILWRHWTDVNDPANDFEQLRDFLDRVESAGLSGVKVDFMNGESLGVVRFNEAVLREAAKRKLLVNFHGCGKPTGESRRYPNEITREAIRGMELNRMGRMLRLSHYAALPFTRFIIGHGDFTPFTVNPERLGGTTIPLQLATLVCYDSPLLMFSENPELIFPGSKNAALLPFVKRVPATWDETRVLPGSRIGEVAALARRRGEEWFIGVINGGDEREYSVKLDFLDSPANAVLISDKPDDAPSFTLRETTVSPGQSIPVTLGMGGGFAAWIRSADAGAQVSPHPGYVLKWSDDFEGDSLDTTKWRYRTGPRHWSVNLPENVSVQDGKLRIALKKERSGELDYTAGGVISKRAFRYGYYEARFKMPPDKGWHTSFWLMNHDIPSGGSEPKQEIDICEQDSINPRRYSVNVHKWQGEHKNYGHARIPTPDLSLGFHTWGAEFTPNYVKFFFDGRLVATTDVSFFKHGDHHIWLTSIASHLGRTDRVDDSNLPAYAEYEWVRYFEK